MGSSVLVRLADEDKVELFNFAKAHRTTASEIVRQLIRGMVRPNVPRLVSTQAVGQGNVACLSRQP